VCEADHIGPFAAFAESWWTGLWSVCHTVGWPLDMQLLGVNFKPGGAYAFLQFPLSELHNQAVALDAIWGHSTADIKDKLHAAPTIQARFGLLERLLLARLCEAPYGLKVVQQGIAEIACQHGALSIRALSDHIGISQNHLLTLFHRMVGATPKELARLYRFEHVLRSVDPTQIVDCGLVAHQSGYHDQSHFNKDFVEFTGHTPTDYLRLRRRILADDPKHAQLLRNLPID
jgi:AraC-like DNA-binding protein